MGGMGVGQLTMPGITGSAVDWNIIFLESKNNLRDHPLDWLVGLTNAGIGCWYCRGVQLPDR